MISVALVACIGAVLGVTLSRWASGEGDNSIAPQVGVVDWNVYAKYFEQQEGRIVGFKNATTIEDVIIPKSIDGVDITIVGNSTYADTTLKGVPTTLTIPSTIKTIEAATFSAMTRLNTVTFESGSQCVIGAGAFMGSNAVEKFVVGKDGKLSFDGKILSSSNADAFKTYVGLPSSLVITFE